MSSRVVELGLNPTAWNRVCEDRWGMRLDGEGARDLEVEKKRLATREAVERERVFAIETGAFPWR